MPNSQILKFLNYRITLFLLLFPTALLFAQVQDSIETAQETCKDTLIEKTKGFVVLPLVYYTPDTRFGLGVMGAYYFKIRDEKSGQSTRLSYIKGLADYTQNKQIDAWCSWSIFLKNEAYILKGHLRYRNFPDRFYGIGNNTPNGNKELYQYDLLSVRKLILKKLYSGVFAGIDYQFDYFYNIKKKGPLLNSGLFTGSEGGINSGAGLVFLIDKRDNVVNASKGYFFEANGFYFGKIIGGSFQYTNINIVFNKYKSIYKGHVIATNTVINLNTGNPPFIQYAPVGGDEILRGYAKNRYRDFNFVGTQTEYRFPIYWRFGGVCFAGIGDVFDSVSELSWSQLKYSYGVGLRFAVNRKEKLNIRFDYGWGKKNQSFYLMITEAF